MLRSWPHGEDNGSVGGGDSAGLLSARGSPVAFGPGGEPPGQRTITLVSSGDDDEIENKAGQVGLPDDDDDDEEDIDFFQLVREMEEQSLLYLNQVNRKSWAQSLRSAHNEHFVGSKYTKPEWRNRSKLFIPKTKGAIKKDLAAVSASMFGSVDAINCAPGNEGDPKQRAGAAVIQELVNYRTDRAASRASIPWFYVCMGARYDSVVHGVCISKQSWLQELRKARSEKFTGDDGQEGVRDVYVADYDRPNSQLVPPENLIIDPAADWTNPAQSAAYLILKWPMRLEEIRKKQESPRNPWKMVSEQTLKNSVESGKFEMASIRRAREQGIDRLDETHTGYEFQVIWVYEVFVRTGGEDWTFYSVGDKEFLTDPKPVREVYPEQFGERPVTMGLGGFESHRVFPMSPVEGWQPLQLEMNDIRNLHLDALKQNVMPVSKVRRGKNIDMDQVKRRSSGTSIIVNNPDDVTWERVQDIPPSIAAMMRDLGLEMDDLAGQFNGGTTEANNALSRTLGGLKLVAGAANAVQEFDIRVWIQSWAEPTLAQIVRLEQYYETDPVVLGLCGDRAKLFEKYGVDKIDDELIEQEVNVRVSVGLGSGDPQQRLAKFSAATQVFMPLAEASPDFQNGTWKINVEEVAKELYGSAGYRDGGMRFLIKGQPSQNPMAGLKEQEVQSIINKNKATAKASLLTGLAAVAKVSLGDKELEAELTNQLIDHHTRAIEMGFKHGHMSNLQHLSALEHGHRHGLAIREHLRGVANDAAAQAQQQAEAASGDDGDGGGAPQQSAAQPAPQAQAQPMPAPQQPAQPNPQLEQLAKLLAERRPINYEFHRDGNGKIVSATPIYAGEAPARPARAMPPPPIALPPANLRGMQ